MQSPHINRTLADQLEQANAEDKVETLFNFFRRHGDVHYEERVTQLEHGLQTAALARTSGGNACQVASALLHDLGHLLVIEPETGRFAQDLNHEEVGAQYLEPFFPPEVTVPIALHVPAKRYLCTIDESYYHGLSPASQHSFKLQGGKMSPQEIEQFEAIPHVDFACQLRRWDDGGKQLGLEVPELESYRPDVLCALRTT
ncbi:MAG: HD family phosphohydrolase [Mariniblastus sp.]|nr:HD family phosphohydrolase [Mariniblastus sp.]